MNQDSMSFNTATRSKGDVFIVLLLALKGLVRKVQERSIGRMNTKTFLAVKVRVRKVQERCLSARCGKEMTTKCSNNAEGMLL